MPRSAFMSAALSALALWAAPAAAAADDLDLSAGPVSVPEAAVEPAVDGPVEIIPSDGPPLAGPAADPAEAADVLADAEAALAGDPAAPETTLALHALGQVLPALGGDARERAERLMARPTDGARDPEGDGYGRPALAKASPHFCAFYVTSGPDAVPPDDIDANGVPDYVQAMLAFAEISWRREHGWLGWRKPRRDGRRGCRTLPSDRRPRTDIYAKDLNGLYGYAAADPRQRGHRRFSYLVVDNDMEEIGRYPDPLRPLAVTLAHEYNHVIQFSYDYWQDDWMYESTATALEEQVFPGVNDYVSYLSAVAKRVAVPLTRADRSLKIYGDAVWNFFLAKRHGDRILARSWAASLETTPRSFGLAAYDRGIRGASGGRSDFPGEFVHFAASLPEWRGSATYPDSSVYPTVRRSATLRTGDRRAHRFFMDHTTYRLARVQAAPGRAVKLLVRSPRGVGSGLSLVGRLPSGRVERAVRVLRRGGRGVVRLARPARFERITAVIVNAHGSRRPVGETEFDWVYAGEDQQYRAVVRRVG